MCPVGHVVSSSDVFSHLWSFVPSDPGRTSNRWYVVVRKGGKTTLLLITFITTFLSLSIFLYLTFCSVEGEQRMFDIKTCPSDSSYLRPRVYYNLVDSKTVKIRYYCGKGDWGLRLGSSLSGFTVLLSLLLQLEQWPLQPNLNTGIGRGGTDLEPWWKGSLLDPYTPSNGRSLNDGAGTVCGHIPCIPVSLSEGLSGRTGDTRMLYLHLVSEESDTRPPSLSWLGGDESMKRVRVVSLFKWGQRNLFSLPIFTMGRALYFTLRGNTGSMFVTIPCSYRQEQFQWVYLVRPGSHHPTVCIGLGQKQSWFRDDLSFIVIKLNKMLVFT